MTVLVIDNYDSFTYNLCHLVAQVTKIFPAVRRNDQITLAEIRELKPDAIVLSPGPGHPAKVRDFGVCADILRHGDFPVLGVCLGHQGIALHTGAGVQLAERPVHGLTSRIRHCGAGLFSGIPQNFIAARYHSYIVRQPLPDDLEPLAWSVDGEIMALRHRSKPQWGVQFHPESIATEHGSQLLKNFFAQIRPRPVATVRPIAGTFDPEQIYLHLFAADDQSFWLDTSIPNQDGASFSYLGSSNTPGSYAVTYRAGSHQLRAGDDEYQQSLFDFLREQTPPCFAAEPFGFKGGFVGYLGFELKADCGYCCAHQSALPDAQLLYAPALLVFNHTNASLHFVFQKDTPELRAWADALEVRLRSLPPLRAPLPFAAPHFTSRFKPEMYRERVYAAQREIFQGESYEICLTDLFSGAEIEAPLSFYRHLRKRNPAPYSAFLKFGNMAIACSSPERFLRVEPTGCVTSKPIKGTVPRGITPEQDELNKQALRDSEKDSAEHLMIVDLVRNDLGRVCVPGSVQVPVFRDIEPYARVHQLVSTVEGTLRPECGVADAIQAAFPAGSMTGAPKARTLEILDRLEAGARGVYSGAIGWIGSDGTCDLNVVIRTAVITPDRTEIGSGGAIVAASDAALELEELRLKVAPLTDWAE